jgi:hypothetical protein
MPDPALRPPCPTERTLGRGIRRLAVHGESVAFGVEHWESLRKSGAYSLPVRVAIEGAAGGGYTGRKPLRSIGSNGSSARAQGPNNPVVHLEPLVLEGGGGGGSVRLEPRPVDAGHLGAHRTSGATRTRPEVRSHPHHRPARARGSTDSLRSGVSGGDAPGGVQAAELGEGDRSSGGQAAELGRRRRR